MADLKLTRTNVQAEVQKWQAKADPKTQGIVKTQESGKLAGNKGWNAGTKTQEERIGTERSERGA